MGHLYCHILTIVAKSGITAELATRRIHDMLLTLPIVYRTKLNPQLESLSPYANPSIIFVMIISFHCLRLTQLNNYGLKSWRYFAAKEWNKLANDIGIKAGTNEVKNKIQLLKFD